VGISELARWACGYGTIGKLDEIYIEVTEGRDRRGSWARYSSCADLAHFIAMRCGVRQPWVNRTDDDFAGPWVSGLNVSKLMTAAEKATLDYEPARGDVWIIFNRADGSDAHVCVCLGRNADEPGEVWTANYGASGMQDVASPGGKVASHPLVQNGSSLRYGTRNLVKVLSVPNLVGRVTRKPNFAGPERWTAEWTGEVKDALEASVP
jgi:hypothetical protein